MDTSNALLTSNNSPNKTFVLKNANESIIELISGEEAIKELEKIDDYISSFSEFDLKCRLNLSSPTPQDYLKFIAQQILIWDEKSSQAVASCVQVINTTCLEQLKLLTYPPRIYIVLTNGKDENNAPYCRNENVIVLPQTITLNRKMIHIFVHELFHIWSKWNTNLTIRDELYASIGYHKIPVVKSIELPASLKQIKMTNPDAPFVLKYYIELKKLGDKNGKIYKCTPIIHASRDFDSNFSTNFFDYLLATTLILDDTTYEPLEPLQYLPYEEASNFFDQIGNNTFYVMHPEEILAENFVLWMMKKNQSSVLESPTIILKMDDIISTAARNIQTSVALTNHSSN
ncbi:unnamed protein product [Rotaria sp. Silwood2]|nr:unnamed protein product [Rotaria sp. Silwood2]CAF3134717.1 unnamed protein product [Rotaria sp. Silwood2]CAF3353269.1 unnamed protein product [Rotaria sp. Silwood2]CAF3436554.1 unnamed protein product [Rotaria sp. Silwood2]CAF4376296.1 unnamed protein product [Rotaria sp. Silwood2]